MELRKRSTGCYIVHGQDLVIVRQGSWWYVKKDVLPLHINERLDPRYLTLLEAKEALANGKEGQNVKPIKVRPLRIGSTGRHTTSCGQCILSFRKGGWSIVYLRSPGNKAAFEDWQQRHGLDLETPTLSELCSRLEQAERADPLRLIF